MLFKVLWPEVCELSRLSPRLSKQAPTVGTWYRNVFLMPCSVLLQDKKEYKYFMTVYAAS